MAITAEIQTSWGTTIHDFTVAPLQIDQNTFRPDMPATEGLRQSVFNIIGTASGARSAAYQLEEALILATQFHDEQLRARDAYFWVWGADGETARRSLIHDYEIRWNPRGGVFDPFMENESVLGTLTIVHKHGYEQQESGTASDSVVSATGGLFNPTGTFPDPGNMKRARINKLNFTPNSGYSFREMWFGWKDAANIGGFDPNVPCYDATNGILGSDSSSVAEAGTYNGTVVEVDFSNTEAMTWRFWSPLASTDLSAMAGVYTLLLGARLTGAGEVRVAGGAQYRPLAALSEPKDVSSLRALTITDTNYFYYELGQIAIPPTRATPEAIAQLDGKQFYVNLSAKRISGTPNLRCDLFGLVPAEHAAYISAQQDAATWTAINDTIYIMTYEDGTQEAFADTSLGITPVDLSARDWVYPGAHLVVYGQNDTAIQHASDIDIDVQVQPRWSTYGA